MARAYLYGLEQFGIKLGLEQIRALVARLDHPERTFPSILIGGTNGKGSVVAMVEHALRAAGRRTGRYTSPHLTHLEERFAIDGVAVPAAALDEALERVRWAATALAAPPSFFEATTAAAFEIFRTARVDVAVLEVGMGGRLDATNVVRPVAVAITAVDVDHTAYLGPDLAAIAREKAGIIRVPAPVVLADNPPAVGRVVADACADAGARLIGARDGVRMDVVVDQGRTTVSIETPRARYDRVVLGLRGRHQVDNALAAVRLLEELPVASGLAAGASAIRTGLEQVAWPGRLELRTWRHGQVLIDGAHNPAAARALASYVREAYCQRLPLLIAVMKDKPIDEMLSALLPVASRVIFTAPASPRAADPTELAARARRLAPEIVSDAVPDPAAALGRAAEAGDPVVVAGSLYLIGEIRPLLS